MRLWRLTMFWFALCLVGVSAGAAPMRYTFEGQVSQDLIYGAVPGEAFSVSMVFDPALPRVVSCTGPGCYSGTFDPGAISSVTLNVHGSSYDHGRTWRGSFQYADCTWCSPVGVYEAVRFFTTETGSNLPHDTVIQLGGLFYAPVVPAETFVTLSLQEYFAMLPGASFVEMGPTVGGGSSSVFAGYWRSLVVSEVPEPSTLALMLAACIFLALPGLSSCRWSSYRTALIPGAGSQQWNGVPQL